MESNQFMGGAPSSLSSSVPPPQKRGIFKIFLWIFGIIIILALILGAVVSFFIVKADPEKVIAQMMEGASTIETFESDQDISIDFALKRGFKNPYSEISAKFPEEIKKISLNIASHQASDLSSGPSNGAKSSGRVDANLLVNDEQMVQAIFESRFIGDRLYSRLERLEVDLIGVAIEQTKWFDINLKNEIFAEALSAKPELTDEQLKKVRTAFVGKKFLRVKEDKGIEWFGIVPTHHYVVTLDAAEAVRYIDDISKIMGEKGGAFSLGMNPASSKETQKLVDEIMPSGDIWVTAFGQMPYQIRVPLSLDSLTSLLGMIDSSFTGSSLKLEISTRFTSVNKPITIEAPLKVMSLDDFIKTAQKPIDDARKKSEDASVKSSLSNIRTSAELWYDINGSRYARKAYPFGVCPSGEFGNDSFFNDSQVINSLRSIYRVIGGTANTACVVSAKAWAVSVKLPSGGNPTDTLPDAWCVDSKGNSKDYTYSVGSSGINSSINQSTLLCR